jgi:hypothetical protein
MSNTNQGLIPAWMRTWWGRVVTVVGGLIAVVGGIASALTVADLVGWLPESSPAPPAASPQTLETDAPDAGYQGGWGPDRETFTMESPAPYAVLNSIINNPVYGDERNFVRVRLSTESATTYTDRIGVAPGDTLVVNVAVANDAADSLASSAATLHGLSVRALSGNLSGTDRAVGVQISAKNATAVWDGAEVLSAVSIDLVYVEGSARFFTNNGDFPIGDLTSESVLIGATGADGEFPVGWDEDGTYQGFGYLTYELKVVES